VKAFLVLIPSENCPVCGNELPSLFAQRVRHNPANCNFYDGDREPCDCLMTDHTSLVRYLLRYEGETVDGGITVMSADVNFVHPERN